MKKLFFSRLVQRTSLLLAAIAVFTDIAYGQANYWTIFGNVGCFHSNRLTCEIMPNYSAFTGISNPVDHWAGSNPLLAAPNYFGNSCYDQAGDLLFNVDADGIYAPDGTQLYTLFRETLIDSYSSGTICQVFITT